MGLTNGTPADARAPPPGAVTGEAVHRITFRVPPGQRVHLGQILAVDTPAHAETFLLRVVDVLHGVEASDPELWVPRTAGAVIQAAIVGAPSGVADADRVLFTTGVAVPLGVVAGGRFRKAKTVPPLFAPVRPAGPEDLAFLGEAAGDLEAGHLRSGETVGPTPLGIPGALAIPHHIGIFATTGMGKSNLMRVLAASALDAGRYGVLLLDPHGEYADGGRGAVGLADHPRAAQRLLVFSARARRGPAQPLRVSSHEIEVSDLANLYEFSGPQLEFLNEARHRYDRAWLTTVSQTPVAGLRQAHPEYHEGTIAVVKRRVGHLVRQGLVHTDAGVTITGTVARALDEGKVVCVDTGGLFETEELLISTVLARAVFEHRKQAAGSDPDAGLPPVLITLEEAQRVLGRGVRASSNVFAQIAREGRKFRVGLCLITQQPKLLDTEVASQINTLFILGLADRRDREVLQDAAKQDLEDLDNEIRSLMPGEALVTSPHVPFALPLRIHLFADHLARARPDERMAVVAARPDAGFY